MTNLSFKMKVILIFFISTISYRQIKIKVNLLILNSTTRKGGFKSITHLFFSKMQQRQDC